MSELGYPTLVDCNCTTRVYGDGSGVEIEYCDEHGAAYDLLAALRGILAEPYGCSLCDSGKARNEAKGHQPDCPYEAARVAVSKAEGASPR